MTMHRIVTVALLSTALFSGPAASSEDEVRSLAMTLFRNMAVTHYCRAHDGEKDYRAARTLAKEVLTPLIGDDEVSASMEAVEQEIKADAAGNSAGPTLDECTAEKAEMAKGIEEQRAKIAKQQE
jgi:hypothetical protein